METKFQDLNLSNYFLFAAAAEDEATSQLLLETLLGIRVGRVKVNVEHSFLYSSDYRSIRLDVYVSDEVRVRYNVEMENRDRGALPQRSRFHQAEMDVMSLSPGESFSELKPVYVVFLCTFDPFGRGLYRYTFLNRCVEEDFPLEDGATRVFLNTCGTNDADVPRELVNLLHYVENSTDSYVEKTDDPNVRKLHERVVQLKQSREWEARYMLFEELLQEKKQEGREQGLNEGRKQGLNEGRKQGLNEGRKQGLNEGRKQGRSEGHKQGLNEGRREATAYILRLTKAMVAAGEAEQIPRLEQDPEFLADMLKKYHLA